MQWNFLEYPGCQTGSDLVCIMNFNYGVPEHNVTISVLHTGSQFSNYQSIFGFKMHTDMFPFLSQGECHIQANSCQ